MEIFVKMKERNATGLDGMVVEFLKCWSEVLAECIIKLFKRGTSI